VLLGGEHARAHQGHLTAEEVEELGQLVEAEAP
jgi:hypothetical protein